MEVRGSVDHGEASSCPRSTSDPTHSLALLGYGKHFSVMCACVCPLPCRHTGGRFLCIPQGERIDSTSIHVWTSEGSSHRPPSQTGSLYSQAWKAWRCWATAWRAPTGTGSDWWSWYPIRWERPWTTLELWQRASDGMNTRGQCHPSMHCIPGFEFLQILEKEENLVKRSFDGAFF